MLGITTGIQHRTNYFSDPLSIFLEAGDLQLNIEIESCAGTTWNKDSLLTFSIVLLARVESWFRTAALITSMERDKNGGISILFSEFTKIVFNIQGNLFLSIKIWLTYRFRYVFLSHNISTGANAVLGSRTHL